MHTLSYSKIKTFLTCPKAYYYAYIKEMKPLPTPLMIEGKDEHIKIAKTEEVPDFFKPAFERNFSNPQFEKYLTYDFLTFQLEGVIDCYSIWEKWCSIADWKLLKIPEDNFQLKIYALLLSKENKDLEFFKCYYVSLKGSFFKSYTFSREEIEEFEREIIDIADKILAEKEFLPRIGQHCGECAFVKECYVENQIKEDIALTQITSVEEAVELAKKVLIAEKFLDQVKAQLKEFLLKNGIDELILDNENRLYLSPAIIMRFGKVKNKKKGGR